MDRWIRKLDSVEVVDTRDGPHSIIYTNSLGDKLEASRNEITLRINGHSKTIKVKDVQFVDMNPMYKLTGEDRRFTIATREEKVGFLVDTNTGQFHDLPTVYDYIRRIVAVG